MGTYVAGYTERAEPSAAYAYEGYGVGVGSALPGSLEDAYIRAADAADAALVELRMYVAAGGVDKGPYMEAARAALRRRNAIARRLEEA